MKIILCGMLYRDVPVVLEMLRSTLPYVDGAVFATAPLPFMPELPDDGTNQLVQEYADRLHKIVEFDNRPGLSHEQQNHCLDHLEDGDYAFWVAADEVATGNLPKVLESVRKDRLNGYLVAYKDQDKLRTFRHYLQMGMDALRTRQVGLALKVTIIRYQTGDHFEANHWSYADKDGRMAIQGFYWAKNGRTIGVINPKDLTMVDISDKRHDSAKLRRTERYAVLRAHGWDERKI